MGVTQIIPKIIVIVNCVISIFKMSFILFQNVRISTTSDANTERSITGKKLHFLNIFSCEVLSILKTYVILVVISYMLLKDVKIYYDRFLSDLCPLLNVQNEFDWPSKFLTPCHIAHLFFSMSHYTHAVKYIYMSSAIKYCIYTVVTAIRVSNGGFVCNKYTVANKTSYASVQ